MATTGGLWRSIPDCHASDAARFLWWLAPLSLVTCKMTLEVSHPHPGAESLYLCFRLGV